MPEPDDRHWLDALAGRPAAADTDLATLREAAAVRQAMFASRRPPPRFDADSGVRRLLKRLREEKLLDAGIGRFRWKIPALAAVVALAIAFGVALRERPPPRLPTPDIPVMTGDPAAAQALITPDAHELAAEVQTMMTQAGLSPAVTESGSLTQLEADWPRRPSEAQLEFLKLYGLARPNGPRLKIEVRPPPR